MIFNEINLFFLFFLLILFSVIVNSNTALHLLLIAEILWITLFALALLIGFWFDNLNILSLSFFFLILSAIELGTGLVLILAQNIINRSINLNESDSNFPNFFNRFSNHLYINKINWKI